MIETINDNISVQQPTTWDDFLVVLRGAAVPADFLDKEERDQTKQECDPFEGWVE